MIRRDPAKRVLIIGEVFVDHHLDQSRVRLGGLFHVARAMDALGVDYAAAYVCPSYLNRDCESFLSDLHARKRTKIGDVIGAPNVIEIGESGEAGSQGYDDLLRAQREIIWNVPALRELSSNYQPTDLFVLSGAITPDVLDSILHSDARLHVDLDHDSDGTWTSAAPYTAFCSTSGESFRQCNRDPHALHQHWSNAGASVVILKENRGGSRVWIAKNSDGAIEAPSYPTDTDHSVGVGDCFDATWISALETESPSSRLSAASYVASIYASTFLHADFVRNVQTVMESLDELRGLRGVRIPWESRAAINVYLAAPDFPNIDTESLNALEEAVQYHNFRPRLPVRENGLANSSMSTRQRRGLFYQDIELLESCDALIALPLTDDPGTFAELGWFANTGKPVILFDPKKRIDNLFARNVVSRVCHSRTKVIDALFELLGRASYVR